MTVSATSPLITYEYTGVGVYTFPFRIFADTDLVITHDTDDGQGTLLINQTDYLVGIIDEIEGGDVEITNAVITGGTLEIRRQLPVTQEVDWVNNDPLDAEILEISFDRIIMILQEFYDRIDSIFVNFSFQGTWTPNTFYHQYNIVLWEQKWWVSKQDFTSGDEFDENNWNPMFDFSDLYDLLDQACSCATQACECADSARQSETNAEAFREQAAASEANAAISETHAANCAKSAFDDAKRAEDAADRAENIIGQGDRVDAINEDNYTATQGQTHFTITEPAPATNLFVFMNSRKLRYLEDFTVDSELSASQVIIDSPPPASGDEIDIVSFNTFDISGDETRFYTEHITKTVGATAADFTTINAAFAWVAANYPAGLEDSESGYGGGKQTPAITLSLQSGTHVLNDGSPGEATRLMGFLGFLNIVGQGEANTFIDGLTNSSTLHFAHCRKVSIDGLTLNCALTASQKTKISIGINNAAPLVAAGAQVTVQSWSEIQYNSPITCDSAFSGPQCNLILYGETTLTGQALTVNGSIAINAPFTCARLWVSPGGKVRSDRGFVHNIELVEMEGGIWEADGLTLNASVIKMDTNACFASHSPGAINIDATVGQPNAGVLVDTGARFNAANMTVDATPVADAFKAIGGGQINLGPNTTINDVPATKFGFMVDTGGQIFADTPTITLDGGAESNVPYGVVQPDGAVVYDGTTVPASDVFYTENTTKTVGAGQDFETLEEAFAWLATKYPASVVASGSGGGVQIRPEITLSLIAGTHVLTNSLGGTSTRLLTSARVWIKGVDSASTIIDAKTIEMQLHYLEWLRFDQLTFKGKFRADYCAAIGFHWNDTVLDEIDQIWTLSCESVNVYSPVTLADNGLISNQYGQLYISGAITGGAGTSLAGYHGGKLWIAGACSVHKVAAEVNGHIQFDKGFTANITDITTNGSITTAVASTTETYNFGALTVSRKGKIAIHAGSTLTAAKIIAKEGGDILFGGSPMTMTVAASDGIVAETGGKVILGPLTIPADIAATFYAMKALTEGKIVAESTNITLNGGSIANIPLGQVQPDGSVIYDGTAQTSHFLTESVTKTVGTGQDFEILQDALDWYCSLVPAGIGTAAEGGSEVLPEVNLELTAQVHYAGSVNWPGDGVSGGGCRLRIHGADENNTIIESNPADGMFRVMNVPRLLFSNLTIKTGLNIQECGKVKLGGNTGNVHVALNIAGDSYFNIFNIDEFNFGFGTTIITDSMYLGSIRYAFFGGDVTVNGDMYLNPGTSVNGNNSSNTFTIGGNLVVNNDAKFLNSRIVCAGDITVKWGGQACLYDGSSAKYLAVYEGSKVHAADPLHTLTINSDGVKNGILCSLAEIKLGAVTINGVKDGFYGVNCYGGGLVSAQSFTHVPDVTTPGGEYNIPPGVVQPDGSVIYDGETTSDAIMLQGQDYEITVGPTGDFDNIEAALNEAARCIPAGVTTSITGGQQVTPTVRITLQPGTHVVENIINPSAFRVQLPKCACWVHIKGENGAVDTTIIDASAKQLTFMDCPRVLVSDLSFMGFVAFENCERVSLKAGYSGSWAAPKAIVSTGATETQLQFASCGQLDITLDPASVSKSIAGNDNSFVYLTEVGTVTDKLHFGFGKNLNVYGALAPNTLAFKDMTVLLYNGGNITTTDCEINGGLLKSDGGTLTVNGNMTVKRGAVVEMPTLTVTGELQATDAGTVTFDSALSTVAAMNIPVASVAEDGAAIYDGSPTPIFIDESITKTVGVGKDFETMQEAFHWVSRCKPVSTTPSATGGRDGIPQITLVATGNVRHTVVDESITMAQCDCRLFIVGDDPLTAEIGITDSGGGWTNMGLEFCPHVVIANCKVYGNVAFTSCQRAFMFGGYGGYDNPTQIGGVTQFYDCYQTRLQLTPTGNSPPAAGFKHTWSRCFQAQIYDGFDFGGAEISMTYCHQAAIYGPSPNVGAVNVTHTQVLILGGGQIDVAGGVTFDNISKIDGRTDGNIVAGGNILMQYNCGGQMYNVSTPLLTVQHGARVSLRGTTGPDKTEVHFDGFLRVQDAKTMGPVVASGNARIEFGSAVTIEAGTDDGVWVQSSAYFTCVQALTINGVTAGKYGLRTQTGGVIKTYGAPTINLAGGTATNHIAGRIEKDGSMYFNNVALPTLET